MKDPLTHIERQVTALLWLVGATILLSLLAVAGQFAIYLRLLTLCKHLGRPGEQVYAPY